MRMRHHKKHTMDTGSTQFCLDCGAYLLAPGTECARCGRKMPLNTFFTQGKKTVIVFNRPRELTDQDALLDAPIGPKVERRCQECGHDEMTYSTRQTRSADEGQTVFYCCLKCKAMETEFS